jgi:hypothetical protein
MVAPIGPIVDKGYEHVAPLIVERAIEIASWNKAIVLQLRVPHSSEQTDDALLADVTLPTSHGHARGSAVDVAIAPKMMLWVDFPDEPDDRACETTLLKRFSTNTRRNIIKSQKTGLVIREPTKESHLREAYALIEQNGLEKGYPTRSWRQFGPTILEQVTAGHAVMLAAYHGNDPLGVHYAVTAGRRYSYMMGGTIRTSPDKRVGHFLHWSAMQKARSLGMSRYDLASGGSPGVLRFKMGFRPERVDLEEPQYYVLRPVRSWLFRQLWPLAKRNKARVARLMEIFGRHR